MRELTRGYAQAVIGWQTRRDTQTPEVDSAYPTVQLDGRQQVHTSEPEVRPPDGPHPPSMRLRTVRVTAEQYRQAQDALDRLPTDLPGPTDGSGGTLSTFVVLSFAGALHDT